VLKPVTKGNFRDAHPDFFVMSPFAMNAIIDIVGSMLYIHKLNGKKVFHA
jgi:hypothetical protein